MRPEFREKPHVFARRAHEEDPSAAALRPIGDEAAVGRERGREALALAVWRDVGRTAAARALNPDVGLAAGAVDEREELAVGGERREFLEPGEIRQTAEERRLCR